VHFLGAVPPLAYFACDSYNEIENGQPVDYCCLNNQKYNTGPIGVPTGLSCLYDMTVRTNIVTATTVIEGAICSAQNYYNYFMCDPIP